MGVSVNDLLHKPFSSRTKSEQLKIILGGKPKPKKFKVEYYEKEQWLTACEVKNAFFCWSCLLFATTGSSVWNASGFRDHNRLFRAVSMHKCTEVHIEGVLKLQMFLNENLVQVTVSVNSKLSADVERNRDIVKLIIDVICHLASAKQPVRNGANTGNQLIIQDCIEYLSLLHPYDLQNICDEAISLIKHSPSVLTDIAFTLSGLVILEIKNEIQSATHVSLILSEHSDVELKSKLSSILRYVRGDKVHERFIGFSYFIAFKTSAYVEKHHISGILTKFDIGKKLLALSCDGGIMPLRHLNILLTRLRQKYPRLALVPYYHHDFDYVIEKSLSEFKECELFFQYLRSIKCYLQSSPKIRSEFNTFMHGNIPNLCDFRLSNSQFLRVLKLHRREFIRFFKGIVSNLEEYTEDDVAKASAFTTILTDQLTIFLLETFYMLFGRTAIFSETFRSCHPENVFDKSAIGRIMTAFKITGVNGFDHIWSLSRSHMMERSQIKEKSTHEMANTEQSRRSYSQLFHKIIDHMIMEIDVRLKCLEKLNFFLTLNATNHDKIIVCDDHIQNLMATYESFFDEIALKNELKVINSNNSVLVKNSIYEFLETLESMNLRKTFKNVISLAELILSMPCKPLCSTSNTSKLDAVSAWSVVSADEGISDHLSLLAIEKDILDHVKSQDRFYDEFMQKFQERTNKLQVI